MSCREGEESALFKRPKRERATAGGWGGPRLAVEKAALSGPTKDRSPISTCRLPCQPFLVAGSTQICRCAEEWYGACFRLTRAVTATVASSSPRLRLRRPFTDLDQGLCSTLIGHQTNCSTAARWPPEPILLLIAPVLPASNSGDCGFATSLFPGP
ncbi:hypothetical protein BDV10DRAFT_55453 [Aspergillus recurvatus]